jgi:hypothetical protein
VVLLHTYTLEFKTQKDDPYRGVIFLISEDRRVNAKTVFDDLDENTKRMFQTRFDYWLSEKPYFRGYHGWDKSQFQGRYTECFVFTGREERLAKRFYGFLCNPKKFDRRYHVCILTRYAQKRKNETDETDLEIVEKIRTLPAVQEAIADYFKEKP